jgi:hypothetical protein
LKKVPLALSPKTFHYSISALSVTSVAGIVYPN